MQHEMGQECLPFVANRNWFSSLMPALFLFTLSATNCNAIAVSVGNITGTVCSPYKQRNLYDKTKYNTKMYQTCLMFHCFKMAHFSILQRHNQILVFIEIYTYSFYNKRPIMASNRNYLSKVCGQS